MKKLFVNMTIVSVLAVLTGCQAVHCTDPGAGCGVHGSLNTPGAGCGVHRSLNTPAAGARAQGSLRNPATTAEPSAVSAVPRAAITFSVSEEFEALEAEYLLTVIKDELAKNGVRTVSNKNQADLFVTGTLRMTDKTIRGGRIVMRGTVAMAMARRASILQNGKKKSVEETFSAFQTDGKSAESYTVAEAMRSLAKSYEAAIRDWIGKACREFDKKAK